MAGEITLETVFTTFSSKFDIISKDISDIKSDIRYHIKRTDELESFVKKVDERVIPLEKDKDIRDGARQGKSAVFSRVIEVAKFLGYIGVGSILPKIYPWVIGVIGGN
jgi:hypothetical protein